LALLEKWNWRMGMDKGGLWKEIMESKFASWRTINNITENK